MKVYYNSDLDQLFLLEGNSMLGSLGIYGLLPVRYCLECNYWHYIGEL